MKRQDHAEAQALRILEWLAGHDELFPVFLGSTGASVADLRGRAGDPEFLASVLDFVMMDDNWMIACATAIGLRLEEVTSIRAQLPGGDLPNWT